MIFKVLYQKDKIETPRRETTLSLYLEAETEVDARSIIQEHTDYNVEYIEPLQGQHLEYEQQSPDFKLTEFN